MRTKTSFFSGALLEAKKAFDREEIPIGAVLVYENKIIARAHNQTEKEQSFLAHAELACIRKATKKLKTKYLVKTQLFVTLEPCLMCQYAARLSRIASIHFLTPSLQFGSTGKAYRNIEVEQASTSLSEVSTALLRDFFRKRR